MAASTTDKMMKTGASTVTTLSAPGKALAATSLTVGSTTNYPSDTGIVIAIRVVDSAGELVAGTYTEWLATVTSGTTLAINAAPVYGSDQVYAAGSTTQVFIPLSSYAHNRMIDGVLVEHNQNGTHSAVTATTVSTTGNIDSAAIIKSDTVSEHTSAAGVTVDGVLIKDGLVQHTGAVQQMVYTSSSAVATGTTLIPYDDTIPQNTEGDEYLSLAITPKSTTNILVIEVVLMIASSVANNLTIALFQDSTANAVAAIGGNNYGTTAAGPVTLKHTMAAGTASATTLKVRAGGSNAGTTTVNGLSAARKYGGVGAISSITITEYKA